jgi:hypothetical protein
MIDKPAADYGDADLVDLALQVYARSMAYPNSEPMHNRWVECRKEMIERFAKLRETDSYAVSMEQAFASLATSHELGRKWEAEETIRYAATLMHPKPLVVNGKAVETKMEKPVPQSVDTRPGPTYCDKCDGTGWTEGGSDMEIGAQCRHCHGSGIAPYQGNVDFTKPPRLRADLASEAVMAETDEEVRARAASEGRDLHAQAERFRETIRGHAIGTNQLLELPSSCSSPKCSSV